MCYAIPGKVKQLNGRRVTVDYFGRQKYALNETKDLRPGDYVYVQGGYVLDKVPAAKAAAILRDWRELFLELEKIDAARSALPREAVPTPVSRILLKTANGQKLNKADSLALLDCRDKKDIDLLYRTANAIRHKHHDNSCCVHGVIEISNACGQQCAYCGISRQNLKIRRFRMSSRQILAAAKTAVKTYGFRSLVLQGAQDCGRPLKEIAQVIREIKNTYAALVFISLGEIGVAGLEMLFNAGARGLLMRFETSNPRLYEKYRPGCKLSTRLAHLKKAQELGYLLATGSLIGLPGQTTQDIWEDIALAVNLNPDMISLGPFISHPQTTLAGSSSVTSQTILKAMALARLIAAPQSKILITTALETLDPQARARGLEAGGSSLMLNATPLQYRKLYSIYPARAHETESLAHQIKETIALLASLGRAPTDLGINADAR